MSSAHPVPVRDASAVAPTGFNMQTGRSQNFDSYSNTAVMSANTGKECEILLLIPMP